MAASYKKRFNILIDREMKSKDRAALAKVSPATITKMKKDGIVVSSDVLVKICTALGCTVNDILECVSKLKLMNYREKGHANYRRIVYNRRSKNNEGAQIKWQDDTKLMMHSGKE